MKVLVAMCFVSTNEKGIDTDLKADVIEAFSVQEAIGIFLKNKPDNRQVGAYFAKEISYSTSTPNDGTQEMIRDYWIKHEGLGICTCVPVQSEILKPKTKKEQKGWVKVKIVFPTKQKDFKCA